MIVALVGVGVWLRVMRLIATRALGLEPDALDFLRLAREFSFLRPWQASSREPVFVGIVKAVAGPFGYSPGALRILSLAAGVAALVLGCYLFARLLSPTGAVVASAILALHKLLVYDATSGLREPLSLCLLLGVLYWTRGKQRPIAAGAAAGVLMGMRWELGVLCMLWLVVLAIRRRVVVHAAAAALLVSAFVVGPFLVANARSHDDPFFHSSVHATWYANAERISEGGPPVRRTMTWRRYYLDFVGIRDASGRAADGAVKIPIGISAMLVDGVVHPATVISKPGFDRFHPWALPRWMSVLGGALVVVAVYGGCRRAASSAPFIALAVAGILGYGALVEWLDFRIISFLVLALAALVGRGSAALATDFQVGRRQGLELADSNGS